MSVLSGTSGEILWVAIPVVDEASTLLLYSSAVRDDISSTPGSQQTFVSSPSDAPISVCNLDRARSKLPRHVDSCDRDRIWMEKNEWLVRTGFIHIRSRSKL